MRSFRKMRTSNTQTYLVLLLAMLLGLVCATAFGHEWTINGKKIKAKPVDFDGAKVVLQDTRGKKKTLPVTELVAKDLQYLTNLVSIENAKRQRGLQEQQILQQQFQLRAQFEDVWVVRMVAANGETGWRNYFANNSLQAKQLAWQQFPDARIVGVQRMRRAGNLNRGVIAGPGPTINGFLPRIN